MEGLSEKCSTTGLFLANKNNEGHILKSQRLLVPWFCLVATANTAFAGEGLDAYRQGHYAQAVQLLSNDTNKDPVADYYMARMRLYGYGELKNNITAMNYFKKAAEKGFLPAQHVMARYALMIENNPEQALYWFKRAADANDMQAQMYCAAAYLFGVGVKKNPELAQRYYIATAKAGNSIAQSTLGEMFLDSRQAANKQLGVLWLTKAAAQNNVAAQTKLAEAYAYGIGMPVDLVKAKELLNLAIGQGYAPAIYQMGELLRQQGDFKQAKEWYTKAEALHFTPALIGLSKLYTDKSSPFYDLNLGFLQMLKAAQSGSSEAQVALAEMYKNGAGIEKDDNLSKEWQQKSIISAKDTPASAQIKAANWLSMGKATTLAACGYQLGGIFNDWRNANALKENNYNQPPQMEVVTRDALYKPKFVMTSPNDIAISEYYDALATAMANNSSPSTSLSFPRYPLDKQAGQASGNVLFEQINGRAVLGDSDAQFTLSQMYQDGIGVTKNIQEAIKYYELAMAQQELRAGYNLGLIYLEGNGVPADYEKAVTLLRDAAFKGNDHAQYVLASIYEHGYHDAAGEVVIKPDAAQAMAMYYLASANDYGLAQYRLAEMLVREKNTDMTVAGTQKRNQTIKQLYQGAVASGVGEAALPLAFFNAMDADKQKQALAFEEAKKAANTGNPIAALLLGLFYDRGLVTEPNREEALEWYQKASVNPVGAFILGTYLSEGKDISKDTEKGKALLQQAADAGFSYANLNLAVMKQQEKQAFLPELEKALALGNSTAGLLLGDYYLSLGNDEKQMQQARDIYQHFAEKGDKNGQVKLAYMFEQGLGGTTDLVNAEKWYRAAAEQGQVVAQYLLGQLYQLGRIGNQPDYAEAKKWYSSAQSNYAPAAIALGFVYDTVDDNYQQALVSYQHAADQHDPIGQFDLGLIYEEGKGRPVDFEKAKELYQQAADNGHSKAMVQLAGLYFNGSLGSRDESEALVWYKKAAELGDRDALYELGLLSETGVAMPLDFSEAIRYYQQASDKGNAKAMLALARIYQYGLGVPKDNQRAEAMYKELAKLGNAYAQYQLATFYFEGIGGKRMPQEGKQLLQQAQENGSQQARKILQWLDSQGEQRHSFIEPAQIAQTPVLAQPVDLMYLDALNEWNRGDERSSRVILDRIMTQFPHYTPAKRAYEQLNQHISPASGIFG